MTKQDYIHQLKLVPHPEGGFYREVYRSNDEINIDRKGESVVRSTLTSIFFLLGSDDYSVFHRLKSDEIWYYHSGCSATIYIISPDGKLKEIIIGENHHLQVVIPKHHWFGVIVNQPDSFILVSCAVAPGFDFQDFEMGKREELILNYPDHEGLIIKLTK